MDVHEALRQRVRQEQQLIERLRLAAFRLDAAREERTWAIVAAHQQGLAIRRIAAATGLSAARVHQFLTATIAEGIPAWLSRLREPGGSARRGRAAGAASPTAGGATAGATPPDPARSARPAPRRGGPAAPVRCDDRRGAHSCSTT
ncbi:MAG: hypothetical protein M3Q65_02255 [Chloroflexota bacterium]|nr:hypothetical protein [Chloroflexota bacterium]